MKRAAAAAVLLGLAAGPAAAFDLPDFGASPDRGLGFRRGFPEEGRPGQAWIGIGTGAGTGVVDTECSGSANTKDCTESGFFQTYGANLTLAARRTALRVRWVQSEERHASPKPYELAALAGTQLGRSPWYMFLGASRILHPDDNHPNEARAFAYEVVLAPHSDGASGFELSFQGGYGSEIQYFALSLGLRFGAL